MPTPVISGQTEFSFDPIIKPDPNIVRDTWVQILLEHGLTVRTRDGQPAVENGPMQDKVLELLLTKEATSEDDLSANSVIRQELYRAVLPNAPRVSKSESAEDKEARKVLSERLWGFCKADDDSFVQKALGRKKRKLVLCEAHVERTLLDLDEPLTPMPIGRFVTAAEELVVTYFFVPRAKKTVRAAVNLNLGNDLVIGRLPQMATRLAIETASIVTQVTGALPTGNVKEAKALAAQRVAEARQQDGDSSA